MTPHNELRELIAQIHVKVRAGEVDVTVTETNSTDETNS